MKRKITALFSAVLFAVSSLSVLPIQAQQSSSENQHLVNSTVIPGTSTMLSISESGLAINGQTYPWESSVQLADANADAATVSLYQYLKAAGKSDSVLFGHMEDSLLKAGSPALSESDVKDVTGSLAAVNGLDCGELFGGYAAKYNSRHPWLAPLPENNEGNIAAAAMFSNEALNEGAIITLSAHMPNFSKAQELEGSYSHRYDQYNYLLANSYELTGDCMNEILPGGMYHASFQAYLDLVADYAKQVNGPVLFRPFHENTGSWFWWGKAFCDPETYKSVFKYTVEYLRDEKGIHNFLYLYGPGSEASSLEEYQERYPGDAYVDLVGFDIYDSNPSADESYSFPNTFEQMVALTDAFAKLHGKLFAVTETGISTGSGALLETGNPRPDWFSEVLSVLAKPEYDCCYFMLWSNYSRESSYYTPFVENVNADGTLLGHEMMDGMIQFYNDSRSIFASDQAEGIKQIYQKLLPIPSSVSWNAADGYIAFPVSGKRILEPLTLTARLNQENLTAEFRIADKENEYPVPTTVKGKAAEGILDHPILQRIGAALDGKIRLYVQGVLVQEIPVIFNVKEAEKDPYLVDDFESYAGVSGILNRSWSVNKDSECELTISSSSAYFYDGSYSLKFAYKETKNGWAGCEYKKETDWSKCSALQFWVIPDGKNQKTVIQINTSEGGAYEVYLQQYPEYSNAVQPLLVTIPFKEFVNKNGGEALTSEAAAKISGIGLWVNAIPESSAVGEDGMVSGVLYYDQIKAVSGDFHQPVFAEEDFR